MRIIKENIWNFLEEGPSTIICVTTNGTVKKSGELVMGKGIAEEAAARYPVLPAWFGEMVKKIGNRPIVYSNPINPNHACIASFPTKHGSVVLTSEEEAERLLCSHMLKKEKRPPYPRTVPGWTCKSDLPLIANSMEKIIEVALRRNATRLRIPFPGMGSGELSFSDVASVVMPFHEKHPELLYFHMKDK